jgi:glycosyltransferase involved in cell wall biosynthesis
MKIAFFDDNLPHLLLGDDFPVGGATVQLLNWIKGFQAIGWEVIIVSVSKRSFADKFHLFSIPIKFSYDLSKGRRIIRWFYYRIPKIIKSIKDVDADFYYHGVPSAYSFIISLGCIIYRKKFILRVSNNFLADRTIYTKYSFWYRTLVIWAYRTADMVICQNRYQYDSLISLHKMRRIILLPNPYSIKQMELVPIKSRGPYVAWIGIFQYQKNLPLLINIAREYPSIPFWVAGKPMESIDSLTSDEIRELQSLKNIKFVGYLDRDRIGDFLQGARLMLNTSHYEGFSNTFLESFAVGTPVICPAKNDPSNIIQLNTLGFVYHSSEELIENFSNWYSDFELLRKCSFNCLEHIKCYDHIALTSKLTKMLCEITD